MNKDKFFADIYVHLHQDSLLDDKNRLDEELLASSGVYSIHYDMNGYRNAMYVSYNQNAVSSDILFEIIRKSYVRAVRVANMLMTVRSK